MYNTTKSEAYRKIRFIPQSLQGWRKDKNDQYTDHFTGSEVYGDSLSTNTTWAVPFDPQNLNCDEENKDGTTKACVIVQANKEKHYIQYVKFYTGIDDMLINDEIFTREGADAQRIIDNEGIDVYILEKQYPICRDFLV